MTFQREMVQGPHQGQPVRMVGEPLERAKAAIILLHGRGARAEDILTLADEFAQPGCAYLALQAAEYTWYPNRFTAPLSSNEPWLSSALSFVSSVFDQVLAKAIRPERIMLLGFSQGACLALEYAARNARRYGGVAGLSGALIGPDDAPRDYQGSLAGTPVFLGCSDVDFHVPKEQVQQTAEVFRRLGAEVTVRLYPNMEHTINQDEIDFLRGIMQTMIPPL